MRQQVNGNQHTQHYGDENAGTRTPTHTCAYKELKKENKRLLERVHQLEEELRKKRKNNRTGPRTVKFSSTPFHKLRTYNQWKKVKTRFNCSEGGTQIIDNLTSLECLTCRNSPSANSIFNVVDACALFHLLVTNWNCMEGKRRKTNDNNIDPATLISKVQERMDKVHNVLVDGLAVEDLTPAGYFRQFKDACDNKLGSKSPFKLGKRVDGCLENFKSIVLQIKKGVVLLIFSVEQRKTTPNLIWSLVYCASSHTLFPVPYRLGYKESYAIRFNPKIVNPKPEDKELTAAFYNGRISDNVPLGTCNLELVHACHWCPDNSTSSNAGCGEETEEEDETEDEDEETEDENSIFQDRMTMGYKTPL